jgi:two-component system CheB/CheR fusion protein
MLIEDNANAREMLRLMLELAGHVVYDAADGVRGLELLRVVEPDVAIIDINLPGMDGYEVAKQIREQPLGQGMMLLALTGYDLPGDSTPSAARGFDFHCVKPIDPDQLVHLLGEVA